MAQTISESVPRWIFVIVLGVLQALVCWIGVWNANETRENRKATEQNTQIMVRLAVKYDGMERDVGKLVTDVDQLKVRSNEHEYRLNEIDHPRVRR